MYAVTVSKAGYCGASDPYKLINCSAENQRRASAIITKSNAEAGARDSTRTKRGGGTTRGGGGACWRKLDLCSLGAYSSAPIPLSRVYTSTAALELSLPATDKHNSLGTGRNRSVHTGGMVHQILLLGQVNIQHAADHATSKPDMYTVQHTHARARSFARQRSRLWRSKDPLDRDSVCPLRALGCACTTNPARCT